MRADRIKVGQLVDISLGDPKSPEFVSIAAEVVDREDNQEAVAGLLGWGESHPDNKIALRLRREGKTRGGCWVGIPATDQLSVLRR